MNISSSIGLKGRFRFVVRKASTGEITKELPWTDNIVLDYGLARMSKGQWIDRCLIGNGNTVPEVTDISLTNFVASSTNQVSKTYITNSSVEPYYIGATLVYRFNEGVGTGILREVGLGWANNAAWNKALIVDDDGNPTDLIKLEDEFLDIFCQVRMYVESSYSGSIRLLDGDDEVISEHTVTGLPMIWNSTFDAKPFGYGSYVSVGSSFKLFTGTIGNIVTSQPSGTELTHTNNNGSQISVTFPTETSMLTTLVYGLTSGNGTIASMAISRKDNFGAVGGSAVSPGYKFEINPPIVKDNTQKLRIQHLLTWGRFTG